MKAILIVDDHPMVQLGLSYQIRKMVADCQVHLAETYDQMIAILDKHAIDMLILDLSIPGGSGPKTIGEVRQMRPQVKILVYTSRDEVLNAPLYLQEGADGYLHKMASPADTQIAVQTVLDGKKYLSPKLQAYLLDFGMNEPTNGYDKLSPREKDILHGLLDGLTVKEISVLLRMKQSTVSTYKERIMDKLEVENMVELYKKMHWFIE
ncbi:response regulator transcription factor [Dyadobacter sp. 676]|uniref:Response regulator transcription factor n=1 Tax=Dyadobacter sp. 676 TaxID=3088362 RepID=A0AAU8FES1_9BACT